jgi:hypothetical protein
VGELKNAQIFNFYITDITRLLPTERPIGQSLLKVKDTRRTLTLSNPIFLPPAYSPAIIYFGLERGWWLLVIILQF